MEKTLGIVVVKRGNLLECQFMNILIENSETLEYLASGGKWTKNPLSGRCFQASEAAIQVAKSEAIGKFNIVGHIPATNQFINMDHGRGKGLPTVDA